MKFETNKKKTKVASKLIYKHPLVAEVTFHDDYFFNKANGYTFEYKYIVVLKKGYVFSGYETHAKHFTSVSDFKSTGIIECYCSKEGCGEIHSKSRDSEKPAEEIEGEQ